MQLISAVVQIGQVEPKEKTGRSNFKGKLTLSVKQILNMGIMMIQLPSSLNRRLIIKYCVMKLAYPRRVELM